MANGATMSINGWIRFYTQDNPDREWFFKFGTNDLGSKARKEACSRSSKLLAHRFGDDIWEIGGVEPLGCLTRNAAKGRGFTFHGIYKMPFLVTAERLP